MMLTTTIERKFAIALEKDTLKKIFSLLTEYYPDSSVFIFTILKNKSTLRFENVDELLNYDNFGDYRIERLIIEPITFSSDYKIDFASMPHPILSYRSTVSISYTLDNKNEAIGFRAKIDAIFCEMKLSRNYTILSKISYPIIVVLPILLWFFYIAKKEPFPLPIFCLVMIISVCIPACCLIIDKFWSALFPPIHFLLGREVERLKNLEKIRSNIFWCVFVAMVIGIFATHIARFI